MIEVKFTCAGCGLTDRPVRVRYREPGEDVVRWMNEAVSPAVSDMHAFFAPVCTSPKFDLKIPLVSIDATRFRPVGADPSAEAPAP